MKITTTVEPLHDVGPRVRFVIGPVSNRAISTTARGRKKRRRAATDPGRNPDMILNDGQQVALRAVLTSRAGNPVPVENAGSLVWTSSDPTVITVQDMGNGTAMATTTGVLGVATVTLRNDFNDDGTEDFQGSLAFDVVAGDVGGIAIAAGDPVSRFNDAEVPPPAPEPAPEPLPDPLPETPDTTPPDVFPSPEDTNPDEPTPTVPTEPSEPAPNPDEGFPTP